MRNLLLILLILIPLYSCNREVDLISGATLKPEYLKQYLEDPAIRAIYNNDNYDNQPVIKLKGTLPYISGEVLNPGKASFTDINMVSVNVKELLPSDGGKEPVFIGAFRYSGYALADLVKDFVVEKKNKAEFGLNHDLYVVVENDNGDYAVFSWGELFLSKLGKEIILATEVNPIFPTASDDKWEVPGRYKLVAANDYLTVRNIEQPTKISVRSFPGHFPGVKGASPIYAPDLTISRGEKSVMVSNYAVKKPAVTLRTVFFGGHKGFRSLASFAGTSFGDILLESEIITEDDLATGIIAIGAKDGYRILYSISEIANRSDLEAVMLIDRKDSDEGRFLIFPAGDFFADRQLKGALTGIILTPSKIAP